MSSHDTHPFALDFAMYYYEQKSKPEHVQYAKTMEKMIIARFNVRNFATLDFALLEYGNMLHALESSVNDYNSERKHPIYKTCMEVQYTLLPLMRLRIKTLLADYV